MSLMSHHTSTGSFQNDSISLSVDGSMPRQRRASLPRYVVMPDDADSPAPISAKMRCDDFRCAVNSANSSRGMFKSSDGSLVVRNLRFSCLALRADEADDFDGGPELVRCL